MKISTDLGVAEIREADADATTREYYERLKDRLGTPWLNLIWRAIAAVPGGLPWCFDLVDRAIGFPALRGAAASLRAEWKPPSLPAVPASAFGCVGLSIEDLARIGRLFEAYNRSNSINLVSTRAILVYLRDPSPHPSESSLVEPPVSTPPGPIGAPAEFSGLPLPLRLDEMPAELRDLVERLNAIGETSSSPVVATLWRHLAHWPAFLALAHTALAPLRRRAATRTPGPARPLSAAREQLLAAADREAGRLLRAAVPRLPAPPGPVTTRGLVDLIDRFTPGVFGRVVPISEALAGLIPPPGGQ